MEIFLNFYDQERFKQTSRNILAIQRSSYLFLINFKNVDKKLNEKNVFRNRKKTPEQSGLTTLMWKDVGIAQQIVKSKPFENIALYQSFFSCYNSPSVKTSLGKKFNWTKVTHRWSIFDNCRDFSIRHWLSILTMT